MNGLAERFRSINGAPAAMRDRRRATASKALTSRAPVGGLMLFDDLSAVPDGGALVLTNWFCLRNTVRVRGGSVERSTGLGDNVRAIAVYEAGASRKAFSFSGDATDDIHDVSSPGAVGAAMVTGLANAVWAFAQITTSGGTFLIACGKGNSWRIYNGTSWAVNSMTGAYTAANISQAWQHANRLFFVESGTTNAWYLAVDSIAGAATKFPLGGIFPRGGSLVAGATWTTDAGNSGLQSTCIFLSSEGDVAVYEGADPASWSLRGVYQIAKPCGINCFMKTGGDLAIMTEDGVIAMSQAVSLDRSALANESVSKNILPLWRTRVEGSDTALWQIVRRDVAGMAIVASPKSSTGAAQQFVANLQTGAWSIWKGWDSDCFATIGDDLVFGTRDGRIMTADGGGTDDGVPYTASYVGPFMMQGGKIVVGKLSRVVVQSAEDFAPQVSMNFDYSTTLPTPPSSGISTSGDLWGTAVWGTFRWGRASKTRQVWQSTPGRGAAFAPCVQYTIEQIEAPSIELVRVDMVIETGEVVT